MIASPAVALAAMLGPAALVSLGRRIEGGLLAAVLATGILVSNAFAYHDVSLAPRDRLGELAAIGTRIKGQGPTLYPEFEEFGKHFLRQGDPEGSSEGWQRRLGRLRNGDFPHQGFSYDLDVFPLRYVVYYRTIVTRRSPVRSRPPSVYRKTYSGRFYEVWQRPPGLERRVLDHVSLGKGFQRGDRLGCGSLRGFAAQARMDNARLADVHVAPTHVILPAKTAFPPAWFVDPTDPNVLRPLGPGTVRSSVVLTEPGQYEIWAQGSFGRGYEFLVDKRRVGRVDHQLNGRGDFVSLGQVALRPGRHVVELVRGGGGLRPGDGLLELIGPIVIVRYQPDQDRVRYLRPAQFRKECGRWLDWLEVVRG
jgi:hypothetical protein